MASQVKNPELTAIYLNITFPKPFFSLEQKHEIPKKESKPPLFVNPLGKRWPAHQGLLSNTLGVGGCHMCHALSPCAVGLFCFCCYC